MNLAATKTISLLLFILIGYLIRNKIKSKEQRDGVKTLILSLALPATIFIALLQIDFKSGLIVIPLLSLGFNITLHLFMDKLPWRAPLNIPLNQYRTLILLIPSLAPGLSCFPFIMEYSGQDALAMAALADVGNKVFGLIISYTIAMKWYFEVSQQSELDRRSKIKSILQSLISEPINIVIVIAIVMLSVGLTYDFFPEFMRLSIDRISLLMTPLVLLFIGTSVKLNWSQARVISAALFFRSGMAFLISGLLLVCFPVADVSTALLIVVFPQSACSFWPFAHMAAVSQLETAANRSTKTFDLDFAMNILACSMPFSVVLIMAIYASGDFFTATPQLFICAVALMALAVLIIASSTQRVQIYSTNAGSLENPREKG